MKRLWLWMAVWVWMAQACGPPPSQEQDPDEPNNEAPDAAVVSDVQDDTDPLDSALDANEDNLDADDSDISALDADEAEVSEDMDAVDEPQEELAQPAYRPSCHDDEDCAEGLSCCQGECERRCSVVTQMDGTCVVHDDGTVWCWGQNWGGAALGPGHEDLPFACNPVQIQGIDDAIKVANGGPVKCVLHRTGRVSCWGDDIYIGWLRQPRVSGEDYPTGYSVTPIVMRGLDDVVDLVGDICAVLENGGVVCWGGHYAAYEQPYYEQNLRGPFVSVAGTVGIDIYGRFVGPWWPGIHELEGVGIKGFSGGRDSACLISVEGELYCFGDNRFGETGRRPMSAECPGAESCFVLSPLEFEFSVRDVSFYPGKGNCVVSDLGGVHCVGLNDRGQSGVLSARNGGVSVVESWTQVDLGGVEMASVARNFSWSCALSTEGGVYCWGGRPELTGWCSGSGSEIDIVKMKFNP